MAAKLREPYTDCKVCRSNLDIKCIAFNLDCHGKDFAMLVGSVFIFMIVLYLCCRKCLLCRGIVFVFEWLKTCETKESRESRIKKSFMIMEEEKARFKFRVA